MINPRLELRIPVTGPIETVLFLDTGNSWSDFTYPFSHGFEWRAAAGSGVRVQTPVGPLALDYGINLTRISSYEDFGALNFSIGLF
jgi:outer membrane translocation and assembly module TamA